MSFLTEMDGPMRLDLPDGRTIKLPRDCRAFYVSARPFDLWQTAAITIMAEVGICEQIMDTSMPVTTYLMIFPAEQADEVVSAMERKGMIVTETTRTIRETDDAESRVQYWAVLRQFLTPDGEILSHNVVELFLDHEDALERKLHYAGCENCRLNGIGPEVADGSEYVDAIIKPLAEIPF